MLKIQKVPIMGSHTLPPLGRLTPSDDGASRRRIFYSYENTDFWAKILILDVRILKMENQTWQLC